MIVRKDLSKACFVCRVPVDWVCESTCVSRTFRSRKPDCWDLSCIPWKSNKRLRLQSDVGVAWYVLVNGATMSPRVYHNSRGFRCHDFSRGTWSNTCRTHPQIANYSRSPADSRAVAPWWRAENGHRGCRYPVDKAGNNKAKMGSAAEAELKCDKKLGSRYLGVLRSSLLSQFCRLLVSFDLSRLLHLGVWAFLVAPLEVTRNLLYLLESRRT